MQMESLAGGVPGGYDAKPAMGEHVGTSDGKSGKSASVTPDVSGMEMMSATNRIHGAADEKTEDNVQQFGAEKEPAKSSMEAAISLLNSQIEKTHCAYSYDESTKRISIKVYDDDTDELIREVPPEKSLEALKKMWEIAGIIIDEKR